MENQRLWNRVKENLQLQLDPDTFDTTFKDVITVVKNVNGTIYVLCPNTFIQTKINKHYLSKITSILQQETKEQVRFKFVEPSEVIDQVDTAKVVPTSVINQSRLNPNYTFQTFVVGESNKIAFRVASQVSNPDQGTYVANPLYIFGGVGLGKTHLMHAIGNAILDNDFSKRVLYIYATDFIDDYTKACQKNNFDDFNAKYDNLDALLVDDIQMLSTGKKSQGEFFKLFNKMHENNKIIIITSDKPANELKDIMDRLTTRFNWGLAVDIKIPDLEHRVKILKRKLSEQGEKTVPDDVLKYIASNFGNNIRELESTLNRLIMTAIINKTDIDQDFAKKVIEPLLKNRKPFGEDENYENVKSVVAEFYNITVADLMGPKRSSAYITPRHICMYILKTKYDLAYKKIGQLMGGRDHTTVIAAVQKITHESTSDEQIKMAVNRIISKIN